MSARADMPDRPLPEPDWAAIDAALAELDRERENDPHADGFPPVLRVVE